MLICRPSPYTSSPQPLTDKLLNYYIMTEHFFLLLTAAAFLAFMAPAAQETHRTMCCTSSLLLLVGQSSLLISIVTSLRHTRQETTVSAKETAKTASGMDRFLHVHSSHRRFKTSMYHPTLLVIKSKSSEHFGFF